MKGDLYFSQIWDSEIILKCGYVIRIGGELRQNSHRGLDSKRIEI